MHRQFVIWFVGLACVVVGCLIGSYVRLGEPLSSAATVFLIVTVSGAFGGLLYTARESGIELPHRDPDNSHIWKLGWVSDCAYGVAGGYVVFLILPTDFGNAATILSDSKVFGFIKIIALALVGGYGGRSLVDRALANIAKDAEEAKKTAQETKQQMSQMQELDTRAMALVSQQFDENSDAQDVLELKEAVKAASLRARFDIFKEARAVRQENWKKNPSLMERSIPVFEALIENTAGEQYHRTHAQLGYALKDKTQPDWQRAYEELNKAIELRDADGVKGFLIYEFNRALCGIALNHDPTEVRKDVTAAASRSYLKGMMKESQEFKDWAQANGEPL